MKNFQFLLRSLMAAGDQAIVSVGNLAIGLAFVKFASKEEYGHYSMIFAGFLLGQSLQNAAFLSPMLTVLPAFSSGEREAAQRRLVLMQGLFIAGLGAIGCLLYAVFGRDTGSDRVPVLAVGAAFVGVLLRESVRGMQYAAHSVTGAFVGSVLYTLVLAAGVAWMIASGRFGLLNVLYLTTAAGVASSMVLLRRKRSYAPHAQGECPPDLGARLWECARWALPSVVVSWAASFAYVYPLGALAGAAAVAELAAARLFLVPVSLLVTGWANVFRPRASRLLADGKLPELERIAKRSVLILIVVTAALGIGVALWLPGGEKLLGSKYAGLAPIVLAWTIYFCFQNARSVGMSTMLASPSAYRPLHLYGWIALACSVPPIIVACAMASRSGVVLALAIGEIVLLWLIANRGWPKIKSTLPDAGSVPP